MEQDIGHAVEIAQDRAIAHATAPTRREVGWGNRPHFGADQPRRPQPRRSMRWADVYVCMLADGLTHGVALRGRLTHGPRSPAARRAFGAPGTLDVG